MQKILPMPTSVSAAAHVLAADTGLNLQHDTLDCFMSDDATATLLVIKGGVLLFAYDLAVDAPGAPEQLKWTYMLQVCAPCNDAFVCTQSILSMLYTVQRTNTQPAASHV